MLAIIIPFFKLTFFEATLQSLANQTDNSFQLVDRINVGGTLTDVVYQFIKQ